MSKLIIEICPHEPRTSPCLANGDAVSADETLAADLADCNRSGDCEPACRYVLEAHTVEFRIVARNQRGKLVNRLATPAEKAATARAIYFDSKTDFSDEGTADTYLVWEAARDAADAAE